MRLRRNGGGEVQTSPHRIGLGKGNVLKKVEQYRQYAAECRDHLADQLAEVTHRLIQQLQAEAGLGL